MADSVCFRLVVSCRATPTDNGRQSVILRSYQAASSIPNPYPNFSIWEAARATSAAPAYFAAVTKENEGFIDGGMVWNNPVLE